MCSIKRRNEFHWSGLVMLVFLFNWLSMGCKTIEGDDADLVMIPRLYLESRVQASHGRSVPVRLPISQVDVLIDPLPVFVETDFNRVDLVELEIGFGYSFSLKPDAARALYLLSVENQGSRLVLFVNGKVVGVRIINEVIREGVLIVVPELGKEELIRSIPLIENGLKGTLN